MPGEASAIPVGTQFSPTLLDLRAFAIAAVKHSGDKDALANAIWRPPVYLAGSRSPTRRNRSLPLEAAVQYGLLQKRTYVATPLADALSKLAGARLYDEFARHILLNCGGLRVVEACQQMESDQLKITGDSLARYLTAQGFPVTEHNTQINTLRMWLAKAGIFPDSRRGDVWQVDLDAKRRILELEEETLSILASLAPDQQAFLLALCALAPSGEVVASDVRRQAEVMSGLTLGRSSLPNDYLKPLAAAGLITYSSKGTSGGKSARLKTTPKFKAEVLDQFVRNTTKTLDPTLTAYYTTKPSDIYRDLDASDTFRKGRALEAYVVHVMRLLGLRFLGWRKRGADTKGAEVDALLAGVFGGLPTRWQVQCKNTPAGTVDLEDVAKEVGLLPLSNATHVLIISTGRFTRDARRFADGIMQTTSATIYLLDQADFKTMKANPSALAELLRTRARAILRDAPVAFWRA